MTPRVRAIGAIGAFLLGAGLVVIVDAWAARLVGMLLVVVAIVLGASAILTHEALSSPGPGVGREPPER